MHDGWNRMRPVVAEDRPFHQMALNETVHPPLPEVLEAVARAGREAHRTHDALGTALTRALAEHLGVEPEHILVGPGSGALLQQLFTTRTGSDTHTVHAWSSWEAYPMMAANAGSTTVRVPLTDCHHDLRAMAAAVTDRTRMVLLCNPNNPTGTALRHERVRAFLDELPGHVTVVVDEAYRDFADPGAIADGIDLYRGDERVCVVRTFSKSYGLLSLRVGYLVGHDPVLAPIRAQLPFFRVSHVAQQAAIAALGAHEKVLQGCADTARERDRLRRALLDQGWEVPVSQGNFLWLPMESGVERFTQFCADHAVVVCGKPGEGVRVTVAEPEANEAFRQLAAKYRESK
ncbi:aminotransferase class I/II-fold pyridoxal phosphate-dependent enzyme [Streptomyces cuspidosporus]|uniref:Histidinol-phosphate transaminase n=1 Tax=Streptomyces cuspidosporus TaxID=66882 RepID=A0ABN3GU55_9ACTN